MYTRLRNKIQTERARGGGEKVNEEDTLRRRGVKIKIYKQTLKVTQYLPQSNRTKSETYATQNILKMVVLNFDEEGEKCPFE